MSQHRRAALPRAAAVVLLATLALALASSAQAANGGSVSMVSEPGDFLGAGQKYLFDSATGKVSLNGTLSSASIEASGGNDPTGSGFQFEFVPPAGEELHAGEYVEARESPFQPAGLPGIAISGDGRSCDNDYARFLIKDIHATAAGKLDRLWLLYETRCDTLEHPALFGEIRVGEPKGQGTTSAEPTAIAWPQTAVGELSTTVPVTVIAGSGGANIANVSLGGAEATDFQLVGGNCAGATLAAGARCQVEVAFEPRHDGDREAQLEIESSDKSTTSVELTSRAMPSVSSISPTLGPPAGGTQVTIQGSQFSGASAVMFGSTPAASFSVDSPTQITATSPPGQFGSVDVTVVGPRGTSLPSAGDEFSYAAKPTSIAILPSPAGSHFGQPVTFDTLVSAAGGEVPGGTVQFSLDGFELGEAEPLNAFGHLMDPPEAVIDVGSTLSAAYSGNAEFAPSTTSLQPDIEPAGTSLALSSSANPQLVGQPVTITATVTNTETSFPPFGSVQFFVNGDPVLEPLALSFEGKAGIVGHLPAGTYSVEARYHDDTGEVADFRDSNGSLVQLVSAPSALSGPLGSGIPSALVPSPAQGVLGVQVTAAPGTQSASSGHANGALTLSHPKVSSSGRITFSAHTVDPGHLTFLARMIPVAPGKARPAVIYGRGSASTAGSRTIKLAILPNAKAKQALAAGKALRLHVLVTFQSSKGGRPTTVTTSATVAHKSRALAAARLAR